MVDGLVDRVGHVLDLAVGELDPAQIPRRDPLQIRGGDAQLAHVPGVDRQPAVGLARTLHELERRVERMHVDVERHELIDDRCRCVVRGVLTELGERFGELRQLARGSRNVAHLDVMGVERGGGVEQQPAPLVRLGAPGLAWVDEEVRQELDLQVLEAGVIEDRPHLLQCPRLELVLDVGMPQAQPLEADPRRLSAPVAPLKQAPLPTHVNLGRSADRPVKGQQVDLAHRLSSRSRVRFGS